jgi:hypothetical protein
VRVVAELAQQPRPQHYPMPRLAAKDHGVRVLGEPGGQLAF